MPPYFKIEYIVIVIIPTTKLIIKDKITTLTYPLLTEEEFGFVFTSIFGFLLVFVVDFAELLLDF